MPTQNHSSGTFPKMQLAIGDRYPTTMLDELHNAHCLVNPSTTPDMIRSLPKRSGRSLIQVDGLCPGNSGTFNNFKEKAKKSHLTTCPGEAMVSFAVKLTRMNLEKLINQFFYVGMEPIMVSGIPRIFVISVTKQKEVSIFTTGLGITESLSPQRTWIFQSEFPVQPAS